VLVRQLTHAGYEVLQAADGEAAWAMLQTEPVRLLISDWMMPSLDGPQLVQRIRANTDPQAGYYYIILLTAKAAKGDLITGLEIGADDYLTKPFNMRELQARVGIGVRILQLETNLRETRHKLEVLAMHDGLTNLLTRRAIENHAISELSWAHRKGVPMSFVMLDLDHFKTVNDRFGHAVGDQALQLLADLLMQKKRPYDWAGRWGGEEFLLVLPRTTLEDAISVAERIRIATENSPLPLADGSQEVLRLSLGVTSLTPDTSAPMPPVLDLIHQADMALYHAKQTGRNRVCVFGRDVS